MFDAIILGKNIDFYINVVQFLIKYKNSLNKLFLSMVIIYV